LWTGHAAGNPVPAESESRKEEDMPPEQHMETQDELLTRFELVEMMVQEGRRSTEYWGWSFVLWGAAYLVATAWSYWLGSPAIAWLVTMMAASGITAVIVQSKKKNGELRTTVSRSMGAIWTAAGIALFIFCFGASLSGHLEAHSFAAAIECFLGVANCASSMVLRWRPQFLVAIMWWTAAMATCFGPEQVIAPIFIVATLIGMIGFGLYLMYREHHDRPARLQHA
jgi:hypothetical protein